MKGSYDVKIKNRDAEFKFTITRNITVVRGDSGTGKTTLYDMISAYTQFGDKSGVNIACNAQCVALVHADLHTQISQLSNISNSIVFIDEGDETVNKSEFASAILNSDNYYVLFIRDNLFEIPYSIEEIYEIKTSGKFHSFNKLYKQTSGYRYKEKNSGNKDNISILLTEDSGSGYQLFSEFCKNKSYKCDTAKGNTKIISWVKNHIGEKVLIVADGAAIGPFSNQLMALVHRFPDKIMVCLPESFEWMILKSGVLSDTEIATVLDSPQNYIDSKEYSSWEQFFYDYLRNLTKGDRYKSYKKDKLSSFYLNEDNIKKIVNIIML